MAHNNRSRHAAVAAVAAVATIVVAALLLLVDTIVFMSSRDARDILEHALFPQRFASTVVGNVGFQSIPHCVVICTLCRDNAAHATNGRGIERIESIGARFLDYLVLVYENDSADGTRDVLKAWVARNPRVRMLGSEDEFGRCTRGMQQGYQLESVGKQRQRMNNMAAYRNEYVAALPSIPSQFSHVMVIDFDCQGSMCLNGLRRVMERHDEWDVCACNGQMSFPPFYTTLRTYDSMAFVRRGNASEGPTPREQLSQYLVTRHLRHNAFFCSHIFPHQEWSVNPRRSPCGSLVPVWSSFNGAALYRRAALQGSLYASLPNDVVGCEHIGLHADLHRRGFTRHFVGAEWRVFMGSQGNGSLWVLLRRLKVVSGLKSNEDDDVQETRAEERL